MMFWALLPPECWFLLLCLDLVWEEEKGSGCLPAVGLSVVPPDANKSPKPFILENSRGIHVFRELQTREKRRTVSGNTQNDQIHL